MRSQGLLPQNVAQLPIESRVPFLYHPWLLVGGIGFCGAAATTAPWIASGVSLVWLVLFLLIRAGRNRRTWLVVSIAALAAIASYVRAESRLSHYRTAYHHVRAEFTEPLRCMARGQVVSSPIERTRYDEAEPSSVLLYQAELSFLECEGRTFDAPLSVRLASEPHDLVRGDQIEVIAQLAPPRLLRNTGLSNPWLSAARHGSVLSGSVLHTTHLSGGSALGALIDQARLHVRSRIEATYSPVTAPLGRALVLGESDLPGDEAEAFRHSGLLHLLAVSGTHLVIFVLSLVRLLRAVLVRIEPLARRSDVARWSSAFGAIMSLLYADFSGGSGSAWRAAYMLCAVCGTRAVGQRLGGTTALGASLIIGLVADPLAPGDYSFLLSALATSGLIGLGQPLCRICTRGIAGRGPARFLTESLCATLASTIPCAPVLAMMSGEMTWAALVANVIAAPLGEVIALPACLLHAVVSPFPSIESGLALVGSGALYGVRAVALLSASIEDAQFGVPFPSASTIGLVICVILIVTFLHFRGSFERDVSLGTAPHVAFIGLILVFNLGGAHSSGITRASDRPLRITALDVGQGDAILAQFPDQSVALIDGGGFVTNVPDTGRRVILPYLRSKGIERIDLMVLSHAHPDHITGLLSVAEQVPVGQLWIPGNATTIVSAKGALARLIARVEARGARVLASYDLCDAPQLIGGISIDVLAPCGPSDPPFDLNDDSLVIRLRHGRRAALLSGDIEHRGEDRLLREKSDQLRADLLKVGHHGSDTSSTPAFLDAVRPAVGFISCGVRNRFRHPRPSTLDNLRRAKVQVFRTDLQGSLTWSTNGDSMMVRSFDPHPTHLRQSDGSANLWP